MSLLKIINANVLDVKEGTHTLATVTTEDGIIKIIEPQGTMISDDNDETLDLNGQYLSPGSSIHTAIWSCTRTSDDS